MAENNNKETLPTEMQPAGRVTFQIDPKKHAQFGKIVKKLDKDVDAMLDYVKEVAQDEEASRDIRLKAAQYYIDKAIDLKKEVAREMLARTVNEVKLMQMQQPKLPKVVAPEDEEEDNTPRAMLVTDVVLKVDSTHV